MNSNASAEFIPASQAPASLIMAQHSTFFLNSSSGRCTASLISNEGHFLTARHCLQRCLIPNGIFKLDLDRPSGLNYYKLDASRLGHATCDVTLNDTPETVTIEATSPGLIFKMDERSIQVLEPELFKTLVEDGYTSEGDFVIFKSMSHARLNSCLNLKPESDLTGAHFVFSYPTETFRVEGMNSDGVNQFFSTGSYSPDILNNSCLSKIELNESQKLNLQNKFNFNTSFLSSVDAIYGSSGSSVINQDLNILGILTNNYRHAALTENASDEPENLYCEGSAKTLRSSSILNLLKKINFNIDQLKCNLSFPNA